MKTFRLLTSTLAIGTLLFVSGTARADHHEKDVELRSYGSGVGGGLRKTCNRRTREHRWSGSLRRLAAAQASSHDERG